MPDPTLSLCICTRNRPEDLRRGLDSIAAGRRLPDQVIVSDDSNEGQTVEAIATAYPFVHYQRGPRIGLGANRNACIAAATGSLIAFIDDDVLIPADFVTRALDLYARYGQEQPLTIVSGIEHKHTSTEVQRVTPHNADFWGYQRLKPNGEYRSLVINAAVFPAALFETALFDDKLRYGADEIDIARHAVSLGYRIVLDDALEVDHYPSEVNRAEYAQVLETSRMYATLKSYRFYEKNPLKTMAYALLAPPRLILLFAARKGWKGFTGAVATSRTAFEYLRKEAQSRAS